jgi:hypothetical protein
MGMITQTSDSRGLLLHDIRNSSIVIGMFRMMIGRIPKHAVLFLSCCDNVVQVNVSTKSYITGLQIVGSFGKQREVIRRFRSRIVVIVSIVVVLLVTIIDIVVGAAADEAVAAEADDAANVAAAEATAAADAVDDTIITNIVIIFIIHFLYKIGHPSVGIMQVKVFKMCHLYITLPCLVQCRG